MLQTEKRFRLKPLLRERLHEFGLSWRAKRGLEWTAKAEWIHWNLGLVRMQTHSSRPITIRLPFKQRWICETCSQEGGILAGNLTEHHNDNPPQGGAQVENNETLPSRPGQRLTVNLFKCYMTSHLIWWVRPQERLQPRPKGCTVAQIMIFGNCPKACWV